jgi:hypothetical protein
MKAEASMDELFQDLLNEDKVVGVIYLALDGRLIYHKLLKPADRDLATINWQPFVQAISQLQEADVIFSGCRFYIRQAHGGFLVIPLEHGVQPALIRLSCDLIMPSLKQLEQRKKPGFGLGKLIRSYNPLNKF